LNNLTICHVEWTISQGRYFRPFLPLRCCGSDFRVCLGTKRKTPNNSIATTELSLSEDKAPGVYALSRICGLVSPSWTKKRRETSLPYCRAPWWDLARHLADAAIPALSEDHRFATAFHAAAVYRIASVSGHHRLTARIRDRGGLPPGQSSIASAERSSRHAARGCDESIRLSSWYRGRLEDVFEPRIIQSCSMNGFLDGATCWIALNRTRANETGLVAVLVRSIHLHHCQGRSGSTESTNEGPPHLPRLPLTLSIGYPEERRRRPVCSLYRLQKNFALGRKAIHQGLKPSLVAFVSARLKVGPWYKASQYG